jgi:hypothetical protein
MIDAPAHITFMGGGAEMNEVWDTFRQGDPETGTGRRVIFRALFQQM